MRIAFFSDNFYPEISGISDSVMLLGNELVKRGHEVRYVSPRYSINNFKKAGINRKDILHQEPWKSTIRLPSFPFPNSATKQMRVALPLGTSLRALAKFKPDIIHTQSPFGTGLEALLASKVLKVPLIGTNHTPIDEFMQYSPLRGSLATKIAEHYYSWYYNRCVFTSTPSNDVYRLMVESGFKKVHQKISNPVNLAGFEAVSEEEKKELKDTYSLSGITIIHTGRLAPEKHADVVIQAFARALQIKSNMQLVITGHGSAENYLKELAASLGVENNIIFTGFVSQEMLHELYQAADIFTTMSTAETQCLSLMHAMAASLPSIVARARALPEYTPEDTGYLVEPGDVEELSKKIIVLAQDKDLRTKLGTAAHEYVQQFSAPKIAQYWEEIYWKYRK